MIEDRTPPPAPPRLIIFAIPLIDPLPIADQTIFTDFTQADDEPAPPDLGDAVVVATEGAPPYPEDMRAGQFVSLRIWQLPKPRSREDVDLFSAAVRVLNQVTDQPEEPVPEAEPPGADELSYRTVVEAVTVVSDPELRGPGDSEAFTRCFRSLAEQVRAYRIAMNARIPELTYERVHPIVPYVARELTAIKLIDGPCMLLLSHANVTTPSPEILSDADLDRHRQVLQRLAEADPLMIYVERRLTAMVALYRDGEYADSAVQSAIAAEVLLGGLLAMLLWEESLSGTGTDAAVDALSLDTTRRVRTCYHPRLGGNWQLTGTGPVSRWYAVTAGLRNRVVHAGYRPGKPEAMESLEALFDLERFVNDRLATRCDRYPRTALAILGRDGLERRDKWRDDRFADAEIGPILEAIGFFTSWRTAVGERVDRRRRGG